MSEPNYLRQSGVTPPPTLEQEARDMLERAGIETAQSMTSGDLTEIANLIAEVRRLRAERGL